MAFFDDLGKKISHAGQTAVQKTKGMTDSVKINGMISDEEKKMNNCYKDLGKLYFELHAQDCEPEFAVLVESIHESNRRIAEYKQQIQDIKGLVVCAQCGTKAPMGTSFCSSCGNPLPQPVVEEPEVVPTAASTPIPAATPTAVPAPTEVPTPTPASLSYCTQCGNAITEGTKFCTACGKPVENVCCKL